MIFLVKNYIKPAETYLFKVNYGKTRNMRGISLELTIKTPEWRLWICFGAFIVNFEQISHIALTFLLLTLNK